MKRGPTLGNVWAPGFIIPSIYGYKRWPLYETGSVKIWKTGRKISVDIRIYILQCVVEWRGGASSDPPTK